MKIAVVGMGYVGLSNAILLAQHHEVVAYDIDAEKISMLSKKISPLIDIEIQDYLANKPLHLRATLHKEDAYKNAAYVIIATPTDYDSNINYFDTTSIEGIIDDVLTYNPNALMIIKSTVPIGYTVKLQERFQCANILFSPEFLREGKALYDNLYPSRIIVGEQSERAKQFANVMKDGALKNDVPILLTNSDEAEAIKLFSNTYLAMRVAFFNELDSYAETQELNAKDIIDGVCLDPRIDHHYNNPSFGYGGYCLPKDTKQLLAHYKQVPQQLIQAIVESNVARKAHIVQQILKTKPKSVGIYRLLMKKGVDNCRASAIQDIIPSITATGTEVIIYEPFLKQEMIQGVTIEHDLARFKNKAHIIVANRITEEISDVTNKIYSRDLFGLD